MSTYEMEPARLLYTIPEFVDAGHLIAYFRRGGAEQAYGHNIDAIPSPFYQNSKLEFFINLKTAKAVGLDRPTDWAAAGRQRSGRSARIAA
jgi:hypothetical protein